MNPDHEYLAAGYVLGGLDAQEHDEAERLCATDPQFQAEVAAVEETMALLAESDEPAEPSAETEAAILAIPRHSPPASAGVPGGAAASAEQQGSAPEEPQDSAEPSPEAIPQPSSVQRRRSTMYLALAASALMVLAAVLGGVAVSEYQQRTDLQEQLRAAEEQNALEDALLDAPDLVSTRVESDSGGAATVSYSVQEQMIRVTPEDMDAPEEDQDLQMWIIDDDGTHSAGIMSAARASMVTDSSFGDGASLGVTLEPAGGSEEPTSEPIMVAEL